jgi:hypothetical protein
MNTIYISNDGHDKNDGQTKETAIYSWGRAMRLCKGVAETKLMQGAVTLKRLHEEIRRRKR